MVGGAGAVVVVEVAAVVEVAGVVEVAAVVGRVATGRLLVTGRLLEVGAEVVSEAAGGAARVEGGTTADPHAARTTAPSKKAIPAHRCRQMALTSYSTPSGGGRFPPTYPLHTHCPGSRYLAAVDDMEAMALALAEARRAGAAGDVPVGAVVVADGVVLSAAGNAREATGDPTAHAEILALREAAAAKGGWRLGDATLYVTLEPCSMCAGALVAARVGRLVFGAFDPKAGACGSLYNLCADPRLNHEVPVVAGVAEAEAAALLRDWFVTRRSSGDP